MIILAPAGDPVGGGKSCQCSMHRCFLHGDVIGFAAVIPMFVSIFRPFLLCFKHHPVASGLVVCVNYGGFSVSSFLNLDDKVGNM